MANANEFVPISNPFLVDVIVETLFKYLPLKDILIQRGVCKFWEEIGLVRLQKNIYQIKISFNALKSIKKFLEMANHCPFKFTNFVIRYWDDGSNDDRSNDDRSTDDRSTDDRSTDDRSNDDRSNDDRSNDDRSNDDRSNDDRSNDNDNNDAANEQRSRLFNEYGTHMKVITFNLRGTTNIWSFLSDVLVNKAPNVERLHLLNYQRWPEKPELFSAQNKPELKLKYLYMDVNELMHFQTFLEDIFAASPYLESFKVAFKGDMEEFSRRTKYVYQIFEKKGSISNIKKLVLVVDSNDILETLTTSFKSASIEKVSLHIPQMDLSMVAYIKTFFGEHKDTLKKLKITCPCVEFLGKVTFPTMKNLETLSILCWWRVHELWHNRNPFRIFDIGKLFPKLLTLLLYEVPTIDGHPLFNFDEMFPENATPVLTLKNLELPEFSNAAILRRMGRIVPNLLKLFISPQNPDVFRELWTTWPEIKTLNIMLIAHPSYLSSNKDSVFTGFDGGDHSRKFPSISHLRKLKNLTISGGTALSSSANVTDIRITDEAARSELAEMKELDSLQITGDCHEISPSCVRYLCTELGMLETETTAENRGELYLVKYEWQKQSRYPKLLDYK